MDFSEIIITKNAGQTAEYGAELADHFLIKKDNIYPVCLYGELGAGKTELVRGFLNRFSIHERVISPTYTIIKKYQSENGITFYHLDLYRINNLNDIKELGIEEMLIEKKSIMFIEWADKMGNLIPSERLDIEISIIDDNDRRIICTPKYKKL